MVESGTTVIMEGVKLIFRNFSGERDKYNEQGHKTFSVLLDDDVAEQMSLDGWNVKWLKPRPEDEEATPQAHLPVRVNFEIRPPRVVVVTSKKREDLHNDTIGRLDNAEITNVDLIVVASRWETPDGKGGVKAYVKSMYVTIVEDYLTEKYDAIFEEQEALQ